MGESLIGRARAGDEDAFRALTEPHRRELHAHCYRMLGAVSDAEDALQETWVAAWRGLDGFREDASVRTWLFRIATHTCLNALRAQRRRPAKAWDVQGVEPPAPTRWGEVPWLSPYPYPVESSATLPVGPEARYEQTESISLTFVTALQLLPPRQLAVLVLRDVLGFRAAEVADMLEMTTAAANGALSRARSRLAPLRSSGPPPPSPDSPVERDLVDRFVGAYEAADIDALVALFTDDVFISMPPLPFEYVGSDAATSFFRVLLHPGRRYRLVPTRANAQPAFGAYVRREDGTWHASGMFVVTLADDRISAATRFEAAVFPWFGLPDTLAVGQPRSL